MPFTFSHPLFAAPLRRAIPSLSLTGLIVGSMAPDLEYFIAMVPLRSVGHTIEGFFLQALPLGIAISFAFHYIVKPIIPILLPRFGGLRSFAGYCIKPWGLTTARDWMLFIVSLFIGFLTHLFMDHWTHASGWFVQRIPLLQSIKFGDYVYHLLQLGLSAAGVILPFLYGLIRFRKYRKQNLAADAKPYATEAFMTWFVIMVFAAALMLGKLMISGQYFSLSIWIVGPITSFAFGLFMAGLLHAGKRNAHSWAAFLMPSTTILLIMLFQLLQRSGLPWLTIWLGYHWVLSFALIYFSLWAAMEKQTQHIKIGKGM